MWKYTILCSLLCSLVATEAPVQGGIKPTNVLGGPEQHASFSFIRPGLTQTSFSFGGPSSHQSFSSSIGNPQLAQRVLPSLAQALAYRNPGLGFFPFGPVSHGYATASIAPGLSASGPVPLPYHAQFDQGAALAYLQQLQQLQQTQVQNYPNVVYQGQLGQLLALRQAQAQAQAQAQQVQTQQLPEQIQLQQEHAQQQHQQHQSQNLLGVAYSSAPSVAHVKVSGNGYKFDF
ncbi:hypothetical protein HZH66_003895 [Vespula vulgaris]|uniref:Uncharacterized protein n=1 Tax=Vespula vulgaris TaxID=7454 RepID=A0A834NEC8_VESVU|nr:hypothetical protein HZH66_003895 [Vespula vulgaris]